MITPSRITCRHCKVIKDATGYGRSYLVKFVKELRKPLCKTCDKKIAVEYKNKNREKVRNYQKQYLEKNREKLLVKALNRKFEAERVTLRCMKQRCHNPKDPKYSYYGGRGIAVCDRWKSRDGLTNFVADVGLKPGSEYSIDRINNDGNYEPGNVRWATRSMQNRNRRKL